MERGYYGEIKRSDAAEWVREVLTDLSGHAWQEGIESVGSEGYEAINKDLYGIDQERRLIVVQLRRAYRRRGRYLSLRKDYYLCGRNENGNAFAHPISSPCRSRTAMATIAGPVRRALAEIWQCAEEDLPYIVRHGDVALIPTTVRSIPTDAVPVESATLAETHILTPLHRGTVLYSPSKHSYYVRRAARLHHSKHQHSDISVHEGAWRVQVGVRASHWGFTTPTRD